MVSVVKVCHDIVFGFFALGIEGSLFCELIKLSHLLTFNLKGTFMRSVCQE